MPRERTRTQHGAATIPLFFGPEKPAPAAPLSRYAISIVDCTRLERNTLKNNSGWIQGHDDMVYRYPGVPTSGSWTGFYRDLMSFRTQYDINRARSTLRTRIWQSTSIVSGSYDRVTTGVANTDGTSYTHDLYEVDMIYWKTTSRCWLYRALDADPSVTETGTLLIVHGGHANHGPEHADLIPIREDALAAGHDVLVISMPGQSVNVAPGPYSEDGIVNGPLSSHNNASHWDHYYLNQLVIGGPYGVPPESCLHPFLVPVHRMITGIGGGYDRIAMTGLSGGAATTIACAALDTRITHVYPVSGSGVCPRYVYYTNTDNFGDTENQIRTWLEVANEEETLTMIADGGRRALVTFNDQDPVCFGGIDPATTFGPAAVYEALVVGNGRLRFAQVVNSVHSWSSATRTRILDDLEFNA